MTEVWGEFCLGDVVGLVPDAVLVQYFCNLYVEAGKTDLVSLRGVSAGLADFLLDLLEFLVFFYVVNFVGYLGV